LESESALFHVLNRAARRARLFKTAGDYRAILSVLSDGLARAPVRLMSYCIMPNHFHLVIGADQVSELSRFMAWCTMTHAKRWHEAHGSRGLGPVYQGRFKSLAITSDWHFLTVCRYVERNAFRARLVDRAKDWPWCSLAQRCKKSNTPELSTWPVLQPANWIELVEGPDLDLELEEIRQAIRVGKPGKR
jgi:putative transposase